MRLIRLLPMLGLLVAVPAFAEDSYTLKVTASEAGIIGRGLGELPLKDSKGVFENLQRQINDQALARAKAEADAKAAAEKPAEEPPK